jgi:O-antigen/teichoic acid export membrane protein
LAVHCAVALLFVAAILRRTGFSLDFDAAEIRDGMRFGLKNYVQSLAGRVHERVDIFMLAYFLGDPAQLAYYAIAAGLVQRLKMLPGAVSSAAYPQMAGLGEDEAARFACRTSRQSFAWVLLVALLLAALAHGLVPFVYGDAYRASVVPFLVLLPGMALLTLYTVFAQYFTAIDRQGANIATQTISVVVNVLLNLWLIPRYGILGAAAASACSYTLEATLITAVFVAKAGRSLGEIFVLRVDDLDPYLRRLNALWHRVRPER